MFQIRSKGNAPAKRISSFCLLIVAKSAYKTSVTTIQSKLEILRETVVRSNRQLVLENAPQHSSDRLRRELKKDLHILMGEFQTLTRCSTVASAKRGLKVPQLMS